MNDNLTEFVLSSPPLVEAWIELRWKLESQSIQPMMRDRGFQYALGPFYSSIRERFPHKEDLAASQAPLDLLPHVVRHRFRAEPGGWPMAQIGPGVLSVNFYEPYDWETFRETTNFVVDSLLDAYAEYPIMPELVALRYRNAEPFIYAENDLYDFLRDQLNTTVSIPDGIPGQAARRTPPSSANIQITFHLSEPLGTGTLRFATGSRKLSVGTEGLHADAPVLVFEIEIASEGEVAPDFTRKKEFNSWLNSAHDLTHNWFFLLIEGPLLDRYRE